MSLSTIQSNPLHYRHLVVSLIQRFQANTESSPARTIDNKLPHTKLSEAGDLSPAKVIQRSLGFLGKNQVFYVALVASVPNLDNKVIPVLLCRFWRAYRHFQCQFA